MQLHQIENWTLRIIDRVIKGQPNEDARVELKAAWIDPIKAARRIAGHANAARGASILWIVGVDEKKCIVTGVDRQDLAEWFPKVESQFDGLAPYMTDLNVPYKDKTVVALLFETTRRPFVVKNPKQDAILFEVPWREGTRVRSARREDLVRLLSPLQVLPSFEVLSGELKRREKHRDGFMWLLNLSLYAESSTQQPVIIPFHRCELSVTLENGIELPFPTLSLSPPYKTRSRVTISRFGPSMPDIENASRTIESTQDEVILYGPGRLNLSAKNWLPEFDIVYKSNVLIDARFSPVHAEQMASFSVTLTPDKENGESNYKWTV